MCFSATASFTAAAVLAPAGVVSLGRVWASVHYRAAEIR